MEILILKLGATGDVVRTTTLLRSLSGRVSWVTAAKNVAMLTGTQVPVRAVTWEQRDQLADRRYDLVINLEDTLEVGRYLQAITSAKVFGAQMD